MKQCSEKGSFLLNKKACFCNKKACFLLKMALTNKNAEWYNKNPPTEIHCAVGFLTPTISKKMKKVVDKGKLI